MIFEAITWFIIGASCVLWPWVLIASRRNNNIEGDVERKGWHMKFIDGEPYMTITLEKYLELRWKMTMEEFLDEGN